MQTIAVIAVALAALGFCAMHIVSRIIDYRRDSNARSEREQIRKELEDEILHGGNIARIVQLRHRMQKLDRR